MANPNIVNVSLINGNNAQVTGTTSAQTLINNAASSGKVYKVNNIVVANVNGSSSADATVSVYSEDDLGGTAYAIAPAIPIPVDSSLVVLDKTTSIYLKEDQSIGVVSSGNSDLIFTASWDEIS